MIVSKDEARRILQGKKTQHRVPVKDGRDCPFTVGRDYAISTMADRDEAELYGFSSAVAALPGKRRRRRQRVPRELCRVRVTGIREQALQDMTVLDARAEGFRTTGEYQQHLADVRSIVPDPKLRVWVLEFTVATTGDDRVRFMHRRSEIGYASDRREALLGEDAEVVPQAVLDEYARVASERDDARRRDELKRRASLPIEVRLSLARADAKARHIDIGNDELAIENRVRRLESRVLGAQPHDQEEAA